MSTKYSSTNVEYTLKLDTELILNNEIGKKLKIKSSGKIICIRCGNETQKSFGQGYCYPCFISAPETEDCVLRPELCRAHEGVARDMEYAKSHCLIDQYVYLSYTGDIKVGVTRNTQIPTRWIDQGATSAIIVAKTPNRFIAGSIEVALKSLFRDVTNWRKMLSLTSIDDDSLIMAKGEAEDALSFDLREFITSDDSVFRIEYPVDYYPTKVKSINLGKTPEFEGVLSGLKGQYLIFENGEVLNIRRHNGYEVEIEILHE